MIHQVQVKDILNKTALFKIVINYTKPQLGAMWKCYSAGRLRFDVGYCHELKRDE